jgi:hypothetical protein
MSHDRLYERLSFEDACEVLVQMGNLTTKYDKRGVVARCIFPELHQEGDKHPSMKVGKNAQGDAIFVCIHPIDPLEAKQRLNVWRDIPDDAKWGSKDDQDFNSWVGPKAEKDNVRDFKVHEGENNPRVIPGWEFRRGSSIGKNAQPDPVHGMVELADYALFYPGAVNEIHGRSEAMKTWVALTVLAEALKAGEYGLFVDFEDGPESIVDRLQAMGLTDEELDHMLYVYADGVLQNADKLQVLNEMTQDQPSIAIINGVIEAVSVQGWSTNDNQAYTMWARLYARPLADKGCCVILVDHTTIKETDNDTAIGATAKMNIVQGASYTVKIVKELAPAQEHTTSGTTALHLYKDRPGRVRKNGFKRKDVVAELNVEANPNGRVTCRFEAASSILDDIMGKREENQTRDSAQRTMWQAVLNAAGQGGILKMALLTAGRKAGLGRNQAEAVIKMWLDNGFLILQPVGAAKKMIADSEVFPDDRVSV